MLILVLAIGILTPGATSPIYNFVYI